MMITLDPANIDNAKEKFLTALNLAGATLSDQKQFLDKISRDNLKLYLVSEVFMVLNNTGAQLKTHGEVYVEVMDVIQENDKKENSIFGNLTIACKLESAFSHLKKSKIKYYEPQIYLWLIKNIQFSKPLAKIFVKLKTLGAPLRANKDLYLIAADKIYLFLQTEEIMERIESLSREGAILPRDEDLYEITMSLSIRDTYLSKKIVDIVFNFLKKLGYALEDRLALYPIVLDTYPTSFYEPCWEKHVAIVLKAMKDAGITPHDNIKLYDLALCRRGDAKNIDSALKALKAIPARLLDYQDLYETAIIYSFIGKKFNFFFEQLKTAGANLPQHHALYLAVLTHIRKKKQLSFVFSELSTRGLMLSDYPVLYLSVIKLDKSRRDQLGILLTSALTTINEAGISAENYPELYHRAINYYLCDKELSWIFAQLSAIGATLPQHQALYLSAILHRARMETILPDFMLLKEAGITAETHPAIYETMIVPDIDPRRSDQIKDMLITFKQLKEVGIRAENYPVIYEAVLDSYRYSSIARLIDFFAKFSSEGATAEEYQAMAVDLSVMFQSNNTTSEEMSKLLDKLEQFKKIGISLHGNVDVYKIFINIDIDFDNHYFDMIERMKVNPDTDVDIIKKVLTPNGHAILLYIEKNLIKRTVYEKTLIMNSLRDILYRTFLVSDASVDAQKIIIKKLIRDVISHDHDISHGPLNKSYATVKLEKILVRIATNGLSGVNIWFDSVSGYLLKFGDAPVIYLSELLTLTNFNHLELSDEQVEALGKLIETFAGVDSETKGRVAILTPLAYKLPNAAVYALHCYVMNIRYVNINRLFRGVSLREHPSFAWITPTHGRENLLTNFLAGCLINWAAAILPRKLLEDDARLPQLVVLDRRENLSKGKAPSIKAGRLANPSFMPSVTSFSALEGGMWFSKHPDMTTCTKLATDHSTATLIAQKEGEVLFPAGTSFVNVLDDQTGFFSAREVRSPGIVPHGGDWSSTALAEAYRCHLRHAYQDSAIAITLDDVRVERPNHGLAHAYRKIRYLDIVLDYFAHHAADLRFRHFCRYLEHDQREQLRAALAFSVSGRESEISSRGNIEKYTEYKEKTVENFQAFLKNYPCPYTNTSHIMKGQQALMLFALRWMGNPHFEDSINKDYEPEQREYCNFIHRILTVAHDLDLPRCFDAVQFDDAMKLCRSQSQPSPEQSLDYRRMIRYAIDLNRAHGNSLCTDMQPDGQLVDCSEPYRAPFHEVSQNLRRLHEETKTVPFPKLKEPYQFGPMSEYVEIQAETATESSCSSSGTSSSAFSALLSG